MSKPTLPHGILPLLDIRRPYVPLKDRDVDVTQTWRRHGWVPLHEQQKEEAPVLKFKS